MIAINGAVLLVFIALALFVSRAAQRSRPIRPPQRLTSEWFPLPCCRRGCVNGAGSLLKDGSPVCDSHKPGVPR